MSEQVAEPIAEPVPEASAADSGGGAATLHAAPTDGELPPPDAYFAVRDLDRRRPNNSVFEIYYEDGNVERFHRSEWRLVCQLDSAAVQRAKEVIAASGVVRAKSTERDPSIRDGGSLTHFFRLQGASGEVRNPNFPAKHIDAMKRASDGLGQVVRGACPSR